MIIDYHCLKKYFYNCNIALNYCFICKINIKVYFVWKCPWSDSKSYVRTMPMIMSFKVLKYFSCGKLSLFLFASLLQGDLKLEKLVFFSKILSRTTVVGLIKKGCYSLEKCCFVAGICLIWNMEMIIDRFNPLFTHFSINSHLLLENWNLENGQILVTAGEI